MFKKNSHWLRWTLIAVIAVVAAIVAGMQSRGPDPIPAFAVERRNIVQTVVATGRVVPPATIELGSMRLGKVVEVAVEEGQAVKAGDLLAHLDDTEFLAAVASGEARLREAKLKLQSLKKLRSPAARADFDRTNIAVSQAQDDFNRTQTLFASGAANSADLSTARNALDTARKNRQKAALEKSDLGRSGSAYQMTLASLAQAEAALDQDKARLAYSHVHAPVNGIVLERKIEPGAVVQPGQTLLVLAKTGETTVEVPIDEKNLKGLDVGDTARISADAFPDEHFNARVSELAPAVDPDRGTLDVKLIVPTPPSYLRAEMTVSVDIAIENKHNALVFPREAVRFSDGTAGPFVYLDSGGIVEKRDITLGLRGDLLQEATTGLTPGEIVLLPEGETLSPSDKVKSLVHNFHK